LDKSGQNSGKRFTCARFPQSFVMSEVNATELTW